MTFVYDQRGRNLTRVRDCLRQCGENTDTDTYKCALTLASSAMSESH